MSLGITDLQMGVLYGILSTTGMGVYIWLIVIIDKQQRKKKDKKWINTIRSIVQEEISLAFFEEELKKRKRK